MKENTCSNCGEEMIEVYVSFPGEGPTAVGYNCESCKQLVGLTSATRAKIMGRFKTKPVKKENLLAIALYPNGRNVLLLTKDGIESRLIIDEDYGFCVYGDIVLPIGEENPCAQGGDVLAVFDRTNNDHLAAMIGIAVKRSHRPQPDDPAGWGKFP